MIKLFRNTRKKLLREGKTANYLKYAVGEIILVVIGILIALSINNWNEQRKKVQKEIGMLIDLKSDIQENILNLETGIPYLETSMNSNFKLIEYYEKKTSYNDSLIHDFSEIFTYWDPDFTYAAFENLKTQGVNLVANDILRKSIINLFEVEMDILDVSEMNRLDALNETLVIPLQKKYFYRDYTSSKKVWPLLPMQYSNMMKDPEFYSACSEYAYRQHRSIMRFEAFNKKSQNVITQIDRELKQMK